jgi:hypothetical protein
VVPVKNNVPVVFPVAETVDGLMLPMVTIDHDGPASYPDKPKTLVTNN